MSEQPKEHWRRMTGKDNPHLTVWDIEGRTPLAVTIESYGFRPVHSMKPGQPEDATEDMLFLTFRGAKKALGVKASNCVLIEKALGTPYPKEWVGKQITLRTAECRGEPCIRVDAPPGTRLPKLIPRFRYTDIKPAADAAKEVAP